MILEEAKETQDVKESRSKGASGACLHLDIETMSQILAIYKNLESIDKKVDAILNEWLRQWAN